ncbi:phage tail tube protein [Dinoroseobacter sp. S375]|uniref:phage tail tube protein n=1 Tax=Dinoroseobacter sp. S375 TaxID=3415136 RepID=UPI003C7B8859
MAELDGALFVLQKNSATIGTLREVTMTVNGEPIRVDGQTDSGVIRHLANKLIGRSITFGVSGLVDGSTLRAIAAGASGGAFMDDISVTFPDGDTLTGDMVMTGYTETGPYEDAQNFAATFTTDGPWTFNAA